MVACLAAALAAGARPGGAGVPATPHVLVIGDSVGTGITWHTDAVAVAERGLHIDWQVAVCRRLIGVSCVDAITGEQPPTAVDLIDSMTSVPQTVVVEMGYNDYEANYTENNSSDRLESRGLDRICPTSSGRIVL